MRITIPTPIIAALAFAACGGGPEENAAKGEALSVEEAVAEVDDAVEVRPGQYQSTMEIAEFTIPGVPEAQAAQMAQMIGLETASTTQFCLTSEEAAQGPAGMIEQMSNADCVFNSLDVAGGRIDADMQCTGEGGLQGNYPLAGEMGAESSAMTMRVDQVLSGVPGEGRMQLEMRVTSQRIGECA